MNLDDGEIREYQPDLARVDVFLSKTRFDVLPERSAHRTLVITELDDRHLGGGGAEHVRIRAL